MKSTRIMGRGLLQFKTTSVKPFYQGQSHFNFGKFFSTSTPESRNIEKNSFPKLTGLRTLDALWHLASSQPNPPDFKNIVFVCGQHNVKTTHSLFTVLMKGFGARHIFTAGKDYSDHKETIEKMQKAGIRVIQEFKQHTIDGFDKAYDRRIFKLLDEVEQHFKKDKNDKSLMPNDTIILDDGYHVLGTPMKGKNIVGIEQTSSGVRKTRTMRSPVIEVATSYPKQAAEALMVARVSAQRINEKFEELKTKFPDFEQKEKPLIGIVGNGNIGAAVLIELIRAGHKKFLLNDSDPVKTRQAITLVKKLFPDKDIVIQPGSIHTVFASADVILGCTGSDITADVIDVFNSIQSPKILISLSSRAIEFNKLLILKEEEDSSRDEELDPLADIRFKNGFGAELLIVQGGKPVTFNCSAHALPPDHADLVRTLLAIATIQADFMQRDMKAGIHVERTNYKLSPTLVAHFTKVWLDNLDPKERESFNFPKDLMQLDAITKKSGGQTYEPFEKIAKKWINNMTLVQNHNNSEIKEINESKQTMRQTR